MTLDLKLLFDDRESKVTKMDDIKKNQWYS